MVEMHPCEVKQSSLPSTATFGGQLCCFGGSALLLVPSATLRCDASWLQQGFVSLAASDDLRFSERTNHPPPTGSVGLDRRTHRKEESFIKASGRARVSHHPDEEPIHAARLVHSE